MLCMPAVCVTDTVDVVQDLFVIRRYRAKDVEPGEGALYAQLVVKAQKAA